MNVGKVLMGASVVVGLMSSSAAMAADTRASAALPSVHASMAPVAGMRRAKVLKKVNAQDDAASGPGVGVYVVGGLAAAAIAGGIVAATSGGSDHSASPG
jgi:hypothetical protein